MSVQPIIFSYSVPGTNTLLVPNDTFIMDVIAVGGGAGGAVDSPKHLVQMAIPVVVEEEAVVVVIRQELL